MISHTSVSIPVIRFGKIVVAKFVTRARRPYTGRHNVWRDAPVCLYLHSNMVTSLPTESQRYRENGLFRE